MVKGTGSIWAKPRAVLYERGPALLGTPLHMTAPASVFASGLSRPLSAAVRSGIRSPDELISAEGWLPDGPTFSTPRHLQAGRITLSEDFQNAKRRRIFWQSLGAAALRKLQAVEFGTCANRIGTPSPRSSASRLKPPTRLAIHRYLEMEEPASEAAGERSNIAR